MAHRGADPRHPDPADRRPGGGSPPVPRDYLSVRAGTLPRSWPVIVLVAAVIGAYCWLATDLRPFTIPIDVAVAVPSVLVAALVWGRPASTASTTADRKATRWGGAAPWAVLFGLLVVFELAAYVSSPRRDHPTLSSMADALMNTHPGRAAVFALWLLLGWALFLRRSPA